MAKNDFQYGGWNSYTLQCAIEFAQTSAILEFYIWFLLPRDAMQARSMLSCSVRPSVTFVDHVKTNKHIFEIFLPSGNDTNLVFPYQRGCRYSDGNPPNGGIECKGV